MNLGVISIWIALVTAIVSTVASVVAGRRSPNLAGDGAASKFGAIGSLTYLILLGAYAVSSAALMFHFFNHDFAYKYVAEYSSRTQPMLYLVSAFWAGQEGTFLFWGFVVAIMGFIFRKTVKSPDHYADAIISFFLAFLAVLLIVKSPFATTAEIPADGSGMNPLLQDPWMAIHPPILFIGYAAAIFPFALALSGMFRRNLANWFASGFQWTLFASLSLGAGIIIGAFWAYEVLGWGGYWGWDPVENSSLVPWLMLLALIHGFLVNRTSGGLVRTNLFLALSTFILVMYATFLTRSGVLADFSVHSFVDLGINNYLIGIMVLSIGLGFGTFAIRAWGIQSPKLNLNGLNRELTLLLSIFVLALGAIFTFVGMSSPLITALFGKASQVETSFYNNVNMPVAIVMALLLGVTPFLGWSTDKMASLVSRLSMPIMLSMLALAISFVAGVRGVMQFAFVGSAAFALISNTIVAFRQYKGGWMALGGPVAHIGIGLLLIGILGSNKFDHTTTLVLKQGEPQPAQGYTFTFKGVAEPTSVKPRMDIEVNDGNQTFLSSPHLYFSQYNQAMMREPFIKILPMQDLYISPIDYKEPDPEQAAPQLELTKGESKEVGGMGIKFLQFETGQHATSGGMHVGAVLEVTSKGKTIQVIPAMEMDATGQRTELPGELPGIQMPGGVGVTPHISLDGMNVDEKKVMLGLHGFESHLGAAGVSQLTVEISTKPLMMVLWTGVVFILAGSVIAFRRRLSRATA